jgi:hypothetical protein
MLTLCLHPASRHDEGACWRAAHSLPLGWFADALRNATRTMPGCYELLASVCR